MSARVLFIMSDFPPCGGGIESYLRDFCACLDPENLVVLASPRTPEEELRAYDESLSYRVYCMRDSVLLLLPHVARRAAQIIRTERIDIVWFGVTASFGLLGDARCHAGATRIVATIHGHEVGWLMLPLARQTLGRIDKSSDVVTYISRYTRGRFVVAFGPQTVSERLPPGVDTGRFSPGPEAGQKIRQHHGIGGSQPFIVCTSRLVRRKGQDMLIRSMPKVPEQHPGARLLIMGVDPSNWGPEKLAVKFRVPEQVIFADRVSYVDLPAYCNVASASAMPARIRGRGLDVEGLGTVYLEAQVCDAPAIAGKSGGAPETAIDDETGIVVDGASKRSIVTGLAEISDDPERAVAMGVCGREYAVQSWTWEVMAARACRILRTCAISL